MLYRYLAKRMAVSKWSVGYISILNLRKTFAATVCFIWNEWKLSSLKTALYLKVTRNYLHYRWFLTYFLGDLLQEANYFTTENGPQEPVRSIRNSRYGYTNHEDVKVSYASLETYLADIAKLVETGKLSEERILCASVYVGKTGRRSSLSWYPLYWVKKYRYRSLCPLWHFQRASRVLTFLLLFLSTKEEGNDADAWIEEGNQKMIRSH